MPEQFKNAFNPSLILVMAEHFQKQYPEFNSQGFVASASNHLDELELKGRSEQIISAMVEYLPNDFAKAGEIILASLSPALEGDIFAIKSDDKGVAGCHEYAHAWGVVVSVFSV